MRSDSYIRADGQPSFGLLSVLRLRAASAQERKRCGHLASAGMQISVEGDVRLYTWIQHVCRALLASLPSTLESDLTLEKTIRDSKHTDSCRLVQAIAMIDKQCESKNEKSDFQQVAYLLAVQWRIGYKQILTRAARFAASLLEECKHLNFTPFVTL